MCGCPSRTVTRGVARSRGEDRVEDPGPGVVEPAPRLHGAEQQAGAGHADDVRADPECVEPVGRLQRLGHDGAHRDQGDRRPSGPAQRVGPGGDLPSAALAGGGVGRDGGQGLVDRPGRQPQVGRAAAGPAQPGQGGEQAPLGVQDERRLVGHAAGLLQSDGRRLDGLVRTALGREGDAGRRPDQDRLPPGVDPERPGLQGPLDERVVHDADRQQRLAPAVPRGTELAHEADQVGLGDAQLDVLTAGLLAPVQDRLGVVGEPVARARTRTTRRPCSPSRPGWCWS